MKISEEVKNIFDECDTLKYLEIFSFSIYEKNGITPHINVDLSSYINPIQQHEFMKEGKFYFIGAIQLNYDKDLIQALNGFIKDQRDLMYGEYITEDCFAKILSKIFEWFFHDIDDTFDKLYSIQIDKQLLKNEEITFLLFEYVFKSDILNDTYSFDKLDLRRQTFARIETLILSLYHNYIFLRKNISDLFVETMKFNYQIEDFTERVLRNKEVDFRRHFITEFYLFIEHFLSEIKNHFAISTSNSHNKQALLKDVMDFFNINDEIILNDFFDEVDERGKETNSIIISYLKTDRSIKKSYTLFHIMLINRRNSLHSNGISSKSEQKQNIGKIEFPAMEKNDFIQSMSLIQIIILALIEVKIIEIIIEKSFELDKNIIVDKYMEDLERFMEN